MIRTLLKSLILGSFMIITSLTMAQEQNCNDTCDRICKNMGPDRSSCHGNCLRNMCGLDF